MLRKWREGLFRRNGRTVRSKAIRPVRLHLEWLEDRTLLSSPSIPALLLLDPSARGALAVTGQAGLLAPGGVVVIDSSNAQAAVATGKGNIGAAEFDITGNPGFVGTLQGTIHSRVAPSADPLAGLPVPSVPATTFAAVNYSGKGSLTLSPGTYIGGISVCGQGAVTLLSGLYYLKGGGFSVSGQGSVSGDGVTVYNDGGGSINLSGNGSVRLTPPSGGTYQDITIFQDRAATAPINISGNGDVSITGTVYAPRAKLNITGNGGLAAPGSAAAINEDIVYDLSVTGNGGVTLDASYNQALTLTTSVSPGPKSLPDGTPVTNISQSVITGTTRPGAQIDLETGSDGLFDNGHTTADASGHYSLPVTLAEGPNVLQVRATSRFDQQVIVSTPITLDTVPTTITGSRTPAANADGWNNTNVVVSFSASDNLPGVVVTAPVTLSGEGAGQSVTGTATDVAGNSTSTTVGGINIDRTAPVSTATPSGTAGLGGWYRGPVTVTLAATDNLAGVRQTLYVLDNSSTQVYSGPIVVSGDGVHTLSYWSIDRADNEETHQTQTIRIDTIPPAVIIASPGSGPLTNHNVTVTGQVTDATSGVAALTAQVDGGAAAPVTVGAAGAFSFTTSLPLDGSQDGAHTIYLVGTDVAGNAASGDLSFTLDTIPPVTPAFDLSSGSITPGSAAHQTAAGRVTLVGHTDPNVNVTLVQTGATTLSSNTGVFQFPGVLLAVGGNPFTVQAQDAAGNLSSYALTIIRTAATAQPNAVIVWNQATLNAIQTDGADPVMSSRALAMVQAAVYDAVNNAQGTTAYYVKVVAPADASVDAAVDAAAHDVLGYLYPGQQATFDALLTSQLALLPAGQATTDGEAVGQAVGNAIIAQRANDGATAFVDYEPGTAPGQWQPTAPMYAPALDPQAGNMTPWAMTGDTQFDPAGPPALSSQQWAAAVNQVESLGSVNSSTRTAAQTTLAQFWNDGVGTYTPAGHWNQIAQTVAQQEGASLADDARLFAELDVSMADAGIATWNTKYLYNTWRPITVIQGGADGVNQAVTADPSWHPLPGGGLERQTGRVEWHEAGLVPRG
jgi:hypothetical protein